MNTNGKKGILEQSDNQAITERLISLSGFVNELCQPIFNKTTIKSFGFIELFESGEVLQLESNSEIYHTILKLPDAYSSPANVLSYHEKPGIIIRDFNQEGYLPQLYKRVADKFNLAELMIMIETHQEEEVRSLRYYAFCSERGKEKLYNIYVKHFDDLRSFAWYFSNRIHRHFRTVPKVQQTIFSREEYLRRFNQFFDKNDNECLFKGEIPCPHYDKELNPAILGLTKREEEVVKLYIKGFNSKETADLLNVSTRTIERHFENIRSKLKVSSKREILITLEELQQPRGSS